ncbi:MAG TPA: SAM-dependent chlorinase/fluorinase [Burkholderiales bacterium]|nr:SAM-dependent chlorinase/fluorinase [Burkholderiales bacterium]
MAIFLFTDFGSSDIYAGQVRAALLQYAPRQSVIDLLHDAAAFNVRAAAHLLAALFNRLPPGSVALAVVDPGVGGPREPLAVQADGRWLVGPDNGLLSVAASRARKFKPYAIGWRPKELARSFHGRDLFAPVAAMLARGVRKAARLRSKEFALNFGMSDVSEVIYVDHYGNVITGLRAGSLAPKRILRAGGREIPHARVFSEAPQAGLFWYENSIGLVEIAANSASAQRVLGIAVGDPIG